MARTFNPDYTGFDHITWYVGNARQAASYYVTRMGFRVIAYRGVETGSRATASYVVTNGKAVMVLTAPVRGPEVWERVRGSHDDDDGVVGVGNGCVNGHGHKIAKEVFTEEDARLLNEIHDHLSKHGDAVKDIAFGVDDVRGVWTRAVKNGAASVRKPEVLHGEAQEGEVLIAAVQTYGETSHTLINRSGYRGVFLPGYVTVKDLDPISQFLPAVDLVEIDHCVGNQPWDGLDSVVK